MTSPPGSLQGGKPFLMGAITGHKGINPGTSTGEMCTRKERITTVVAGANE
jgi:hypothetical protein